MFVSGALKDVLPTDQFTGFFPCTPRSHSIITQKDAQSCDLFVYAAVQLAIERANEEYSNNDHSENHTRCINIASVPAEGSGGVVEVWL